MFYTVSSLDGLPPSVVRLLVLCCQLHHIHYVTANRKKMHGTYFYKKDTHFNAYILMKAYLTYLMFYLEPVLLELEHVKTTNNQLFFCWSGYSLKLEPRHHNVKLIIFQYENLMGYTSVHLQFKLKWKLYVIPIRRMYQLRHWQFSRLSHYDLSRYVPRGILCQVVRWLCQISLLSESNCPCRFFP